MKRIALSVLLLAALAFPAAASADVRLSYLTTRPVRLVAATSPATEYTVDTTVWLECGGRARALMSGWSGALAPIAITYSHLVNTSGQLALAVRRPLRSGTLRGHALCATGVRATGKVGPDGGEGQSRVSCASGQLAIGSPFDGGPYWDHAIVSKPDGLRGWVNDEGGYGSAKVVCVPARSFARPKLVAKRASFRAGKATASVSATCDGGRRPLGWGFEAGQLLGNVWRSSESPSTMTVPFIAASKPSGRSGWALTFATPDGKPAASATSIALHLTCAKPV